MAVDTPARIAVVGAGPMGLETALYARFLGYDVDVYDKGEVGDHVRRWGHVKMFTPFGMNRSPLGMAALTAQHPDMQFPADDELLTGQEYHDRYLEPLAHSDLLEDHVHAGVEVLAVGRRRQWKLDHIGDAHREDDDFELLLRGADGKQRRVKADVVIDASGVFSQPNPLGQSGLPAIGETRLSGRIEYHLPDVLGLDRPRYEGRRVLVVGGGYSAATTVVGLAELVRQDPETKVTWLTRQASLLHASPDDRLPARAALTAAVQQAVAEGLVEHRGGAHVRRVRWAVESGCFQVGIVGKQSGLLEVDAVVGNCGFRPNVDLFRELQVHLCYATEGPMKWAAAVLGQTSSDCLDPPKTQSDSLFTTEPDFYILGAKSHGRDSRFLLSVGFQQIRTLFSIIGDRSDLDLYSTIGRNFELPGV